MISHTSIISRNISGKSTDSSGWDKVWIRYAFNITLSANHVTKATMFAGLKIFSADIYEWFVSQMFWIWAKTFIRKYNQFLSAFLPSLISSGVCQKSSCPTIHFWSASKIITLKR